VASALPEEVKNSFKETFESPSVSIFLIVLLSSIKVVEVNQQLLFSNSEGKWVRNGPFTAVVWPHQRMKRREAIRLGSREYVVLKNERTGEKRHVSGPGLVFPEAYDNVEGSRSKIMLQKNEYMRLVDKLSGFERVVKGPQTLVPEPLEEAENGKEQAITLQMRADVYVEKQEMSSASFTNAMSASTAHGRRQGRCPRQQSPWRKFPSRLRCLRTRHG